MFTNKATKCTCTKMHEQFIKQIKLGTLKPCVIQSLLQYSTRNRCHYARNLELLLVLRARLLFIIYPCPDNLKVVQMDLKDILGVPGTPTRDPVAKESRCRSSEIEEKTHFQPKISSVKHTVQEYLGLGKHRITSWRHNDAQIGD